jgi:hypothetical protein
MAADERRITDADIAANVEQDDADESSFVQTEKVVDFEERRLAIAARYGDLPAYEVGSVGETDIIAWYENPNNKKAKPPLVMEVHLNVMTYQARSKYMKELRAARERVKQVQSLRDMRAELDVDLNVLLIEEESTPDEPVYDLEPNDGDLPDVKRWKELTTKIQGLEEMPDDIDISITRVMIPNLVWWNAAKEGIPVPFEHRAMKRMLSIQEINGTSEAIFKRIVGDLSGKYQAAASSRRSSGRGKRGKR